MLSIDGHCIHDTALAFDPLLLFTHEGHNYAVLSFSACGKEFGLYLVVGYKDYEARANYFCRPRKIKAKTDSTFDTYQCVYGSP